MSGRFGGLQTLMQGVAVNAKWTHCLIHREALASQQLSDDLNGVLGIVVKTVNFILKQGRLNLGFSNVFAMN